MQLKTKHWTWSEQELIVILLAVLLTAAYLIVVVNYAFGAEEPIHNPCLSQRGYKAEFYRHVVNDSFSMYPCINNLNYSIWLGIAEIPFEDVQPNDIIRFYNPRNVSTVHRAIAKIGNCWITKGDNNMLRDDYTACADNYRGIIVDIREGSYEELNLLEELV